MSEQRTSDGQCKHTQTYFTQWGRVCSFCHCHVPDAPRTETDQRAVTAGLDCPDYSTQRRERVPPEWALNDVRVVAEYVNFSGTYAGRDVPSAVLECARRLLEQGERWAGRRTEPALPEMTPFWKRHARCSMYHANKVYKHDPDCEHQDESEATDNSGPAPKHGASLSEGMHTAPPRATPDGSAVSLSERETRAVYKVIELAAQRIGEDDLGAFIYSSGEQLLSGAEIVALCKRLRIASARKEGT